MTWRVALPSLIELSGVRAPPEPIGKQTARGNDGRQQNSLFRHGCYLTLIKGADNSASERRHGQIAYKSGEMENECLDATEARYACQTDFLEFSDNRWRSNSTAGRSCPSLAGRTGMSVLRLGPSILSLTYRNSCHFDNRPIQRSLTGCRQHAPSNPSIRYLRNSDVEHVPGSLLELCGCANGDSP